MLRSACIALIQMKQKYCLESVLPFATINHSPTNHSPTKQTFSFSKSPRFALAPPSSRQSSRASHHRPTALPTSINKLNNLQGKRATFTLEEEKCAYDSYINPHTLRLPGVGRYHVQTETSLIRDRAPSYSMRIKTRPADRRLTLETQNDHPSPAHYLNNPELSPHSTHFSRIAYSHPHSRRFGNPDNLVPGPGSYADKTSLSNAGKYLLSSHLGGTRAKFDTARKVSKIDQVQQAARNRPGPGSYRQSSEFGQYDGNIYHQHPPRRAQH